MKLYANGCSFTHGHMFDHEERTQYHYKNYWYDTLMDEGITWPMSLEDRFSYVFNHAMQGTGPSRTLRTTIEFVEHLKKIDDDLSDWVFAIQISDSYRFEELLRNKRDHWATIQISNEDDVLDQDNYGLDKDERLRDDHPRHIDRLDYLEKNVVNWQASIKYSLLRPELDMWHEHAKLLSLLINYLDNNKLKYVITGMAGSNNDPECISEHTNSKYIDTILKSFSHSNIIDPASTVIKGGRKKYYDPCGHPNKLGHKVWGDYIYKQIQKRGFIE